VAKETTDWSNAAFAASNLSEAQLIIGEVAAAVATAEQSVAHGDRSGNEFNIMAHRADHAKRAACRRPARGGGNALFADAERAAEENEQPEYPLPLCACEGISIATLLLARGEWLARA